MMPVSLETCHLAATSTLRFARSCRHEPAPEPRPKRLKQPLDNTKRYEAQWSKYDMRRAGQAHRGQSPHLPGPSGTSTAAAANPPSVVVDAVMQCIPPTPSAVANAVTHSPHFSSVVDAVEMKMVDAVQVRYVDAKLPDNTTEMSQGAPLVRIATTSSPRTLCWKSHRHRHRQ